MFNFGFKSGWYQPLIKTTITVVAATYKLLGMNSDNILAMNGDQITTMEG